MNNNEMLRKINKSETDIAELNKQLETKSNLTNSSNFVNAKAMFNMKADGITDESDKINQALQYINSLNGGTLYFPKGVYIYSKSLRFGVNTTILGDGIGVTIFKMKDNIDLDSAIDGVQLTNEVGIKFACAGFVGMGGVETKYVCFDNIEIDGNCKNNRHWNVKPYGSWTDFGTHINGISLDSVSDVNGKYPIPPQNAIIRNVYIHDTVRNCLVSKMNGTLNISDSFFENSDADHVLYLQNNIGTKTNINNVVTRGFSRGTMNVLTSANINNVTVENITQNLAGFTLTEVFGCTNRNEMGLGGDCSFNNISININCDTLGLSELRLFSYGTDMLINNAFINFFGDVTKVNTTSFRVLFPNNNYTGITNDSTIARNISINNCPKILSILYLVDKIRDNATTINGVNIIRNINQDYSSVGILLNVGEKCEVDGITFSNINIDDCYNLISFNNPLYVNNVIVKDSYFGINSNAYLTSGTSTNIPKCAIEFVNVTFKSAKGQASNSKCYTKDCYLLTNNVKKAFNELYSPPTIDFVKSGCCWFKNNKPCIFINDKWIYFDGSDVV